MGRQLRLGNPPIEIDVRTSGRARRLSLRVSRLDGRVRLTMPGHARDDDALAFVAEREGWLRETLATVAGPVAVDLGTVLPVAGHEVQVVGAARGPVRQEGDQLLVRGGGRAVGPQVQAYLKARARDALARRSDLHAAALGRPYTKLTLRDTRSRWGSCTTAGGLMYSWRLIMAPEAVLDYVAAHEVAHLAEMNHSPRFWAVVAGLCPGYEVHRRWLRHEGNTLHRYDFA